MVENGNGNGENVVQPQAQAQPLDVGVGGLQSFDPRSDPHNVSQRWKKWLRAFRLYVMGKGVTQDAQKQALLLHTAGLEVQDIYYTLVGDDENKTYDETVTILNGYFTPKQNVPFERHLFRQIVQTSEETMDQFVCRLRTRASTCEFVNVDEAIRDQIIDWCYSNQLRRKLLEKDKLDLKTALDTARAYEAVNHRVKEMEIKPASVNAVNTDKKMPGTRGDQRKKECFACGYSGHFARDRQCPARKAKCIQCGEMEHFK